MELLFDFALVGGAFDAANLGSPAWRDDGKTPPPASILVAVCGKGQTCGSTKCRMTREHVAFWTPDEKDRPARTVEYRKQDEYVERVEREDADDDLRGRATYAIGGLLDPRNFGEKARDPFTAFGGRSAPDAPLPAPEHGRELLPAGRHDRGRPR